MNQFFPLTEEPFLVGETNLSAFMNRPQRLQGGLIFLCFKGHAVLSTELTSREITPNTKVTLLPRTILTLHEASSDFKGKFIAFSHELFNEVNFRLEGSFFRFLKENPIYVLPEEKMFLLECTFRFIFTVYNDRENRFRYHIIKNQLQCIFWETYDKTQRIFNIQKSSTMRNMELFHGFIALVQEFCTKEREVSFYANKLCISPRYLSAISRQVTSSKSAKDIIDNHLILEIKALLTSTNLPIQEIAHRLHFPDQSYLGRYFKRYTNESPTEYRSRTGGTINPIGKE
ncbi:MAG: helix-turn-helix domain-containing protein [Tannerellaceae bacterium]|nr:helix-turn-helix domain-containing protein [Tannerellaceae bacterium]